MRFDPDKHHRRSIRLREYDYTAPGEYFVTIVAQERLCLFGEVIGGQMLMNEAGRMIEAVWATLHNRFGDVVADAIAVMPNHVHGIIVIGPRVSGMMADAEDAGVGAPVLAQMEGSFVGAPFMGALGTDSRATTRVAPTGGGDGRDTTPGFDLGDLPRLGDIVGAFKSITTNEYIRGVSASGWPAFPGRLWQRNYYEHVIRDETELLRICQYIADNPLRWESDRENPLARVTLVRRRGGDEPWQV